jgi:hypothetical protein
MWRPLFASQLPPDPGERWEQNGPSYANAAAAMSEPVTAIAQTAPRGHRLRSADVVADELDLTHGCTASKDMAV